MSKVSDLKAKAPKAEAPTPTAPAVAAATAAAPTALPKGIREVRAAFVRVCKDQSSMYASKLASGLTVIVYLPEGAPHREALTVAVDTTGLGV